jgi:hypothetical protein
MCMACQMEDELWFAYLDQVARQERQERQEKAAVAAADPAAGPAAEHMPAKKPPPASSFVCEEPPSE